MSPDVRKLNEAQLFGVGKLETQKPQQNPSTALAGKPSGQQGGLSRVDKHGPRIRVTLIRFGSKTLDGDNLRGGGFKALRDAIARWLGLDDADDVIDWEYAQCVTRGRQGTAVRIEKIV